MKLVLCKKTRKISTIGERFVGPIVEKFRFLENEHFVFRASIRNGLRPARTYSAGGCYKVRETKSCTYPE